MKSLGVFKMRKPIKINDDFFFIGLTERERYLISLVREYSPINMELGEIVGTMKYYFNEQIQENINTLIKEVIK